MDFDEKDIEFFNNFENKTYQEIFAQFKLLTEESKMLGKHPKINLRKLEITKEKMRNFVSPNRMYERLGVDTLAVMVANNLVPLCDPDRNGTFLPEISVLRQMLTDTYGYILPNIRVMDTSAIEKNRFEIYVRSKKVYCGKISDDDLRQNNSREIIKNLYKVCFDYAHYIMTQTDALKLMELVRSQDPSLVDDIIPTYISPFDLKHICANLIQRKVGIKDILLVIETLNENVKYTQDVNELTDIVEKKLLFAPHELGQ